MKKKISEFALCWIVVGPVWSAHGPFSHKDAVKKKNGYNSALPEGCKPDGFAHVRLADGTEVNDEGYPIDEN